MSAAEVTIVCPRCNGRDFSVDPVPSREEPYRCELKCVVCGARLEMQLHLPPSAGANSERAAREAAEARARDAEDIVRVAGDNLRISVDRPQDLITHVECLRADVSSLRGALRGLVARLDEVHADGAYQAVWTIAQIHAGPYRGPTYTEALAAARALAW